MLFTTLAYAAFFAVVAVVHWLIPPSLHRFWLLGASYWFYMQTIPQYVWLIGAMTLVNYALGLALGGATGQRLKRDLLVGGIAANLVTLAGFKYAALLVGAIWPVVRLLPAVPTNTPEFTILLPLGISFFTFEFIHYLAEVARGQAPIHDPFEFALFAAFFPTQIAGPIKRFPDWIRARAHPMRLSAIRVDEGLWLIVRGACKKIVIADALAPLVAGGFDHPERLGLLTTWFVIYAFAAQIFADFSGYTDIGRGCALLLGFAVPENFNSPYQARNPSEFWERWHISLSRWLRDYLFIPLGGSRVPGWRITLNLMITMGLGGLWHGASWHFLAWGIYQGGLLVGFRRCQTLIARHPTASRFWAAPHGVLLGRIATFHLVCLGWLIFRAASLPAAGSLLLHALVPMIPFTAGYATLLRGSKALPTLVLALAGATVIVRWVWDWAWASFSLQHTYTRLLGWGIRWLPWAQPVMTLAVLVLVVIWPAGRAQTFIYFRF